MLSDEEKAAIREAAKEGAAVGLILIETAKGLFDSLIENPEIFATYAKLFRQSVDALVKEGFTHTEAVNIATNVLSKLTANDKG